MFGLTSSELLIFAVVILILFGKRIPETMRSLGRGLSEFKRGVQDTDGDAPAELQ